MANREDFLAEPALDWVALQAEAAAAQPAPTVRDTHDLQMGALYVPRGTQADDPDDEAALLAAGLPPEDAKAVAIARWSWDQMRRAEAKTFAPEMTDSQRNQFIGIRNAYAEMLRYLGFDPLAGRPKLSISQSARPTHGESADAEL